MYDENTFKNYIFWLKVKRVFFMIVFSIIGAFIGLAISELVVNILLFDGYLKPIIITISTLLFFAISLLVTAGTGKEVQDGYWKIAVLRKLTVISKKLDNVQIVHSGESTKIKETEELSNEIHKTITESLEKDKSEIKEISENNKDAKEKKSKRKTAESSDKK